MKNSLFLRTLSLLPLLMSLWACANDSGQDSSSTLKALPFACSEQNASTMYFDESHKNYLAGELSSPGIKNFLVFGDSLSDSGELGRKTKDLLVPKCKYWMNHFSNGPVWTEYVSGGAQWKMKSYAVGGSGTSKERGDSLFGWTAYLNPFKIKDTFQDLVLTSLLDQIDQFAKELKEGKTNLSGTDTIVSIWSGPNNYFIHGRDVQDSAGKVDKIKAQELVDETIGDLNLAITRLRDLGFNRISLGNMPVLTDLPPDPSDLIKLASSETLAYLSINHNKGIESLIEKFKGEGLDIMLFEADAILTKTTLYPARYGFDSVEACYAGTIFGYTKGGSKDFCKTPLRQKSWDYPHPNTRMHCLYASQFAQNARAAGWIEAGEDFVEKCVQMRTKTGIE
jgi:phospholipase/lecithinase/hemolysin